MNVSITTIDGKQVILTTTDESNVFKMDPVSSEVAKAVAAAVKAETALDALITSDSVDTIVKLTQAEYDALIPDEKTLYLIT